MLIFRYMHLEFSLGAQYFVLFLLLKNFLFVCLFVVCWLGCVGFFFFFFFGLFVFCAWWFFMCFKKRFE